MAVHCKLSSMEYILKFNILNALGHGKLLSSVVYIGNCILTTASVRSTVKISVILKLKLHFNVSPDARLILKSLKS